MKEAKIRICRLCLALLDDDDEFNFISNLQIEMLNIILPELNINVPQQLVVICSNCAIILEEAFTFKSTFLEIDDTIHGYKDEGQEPVDLEKVIGINDIPDSISKDGKVCRTCLQLLEDDCFLEISSENSALIGVLQKCLPEMDIQLTKHPMICHTCITTLEKIFNFLTLLLKKEATIKDYLEINDCEDIDLYDVVRYTWSNEVKNTLSISKTEVEIHIKDEGIIQPTTINATTAQNGGSLHNPTLINLNSESKENGIYVISDDDEDNKFSSSANTTETSVETSKTLNLTVSNAMQLPNDENTTTTANTCKNRRESYLTAIETIKARATEFNEISDNDSMYSMETENSDEDISSDDFNKKRKKVAHAKTVFKNIEISEKENIEDNGDLDVSDKASVYSITSENSDDDVNRINSKSEDVVPAKRRITNNASTVKSKRKIGSQVIDVSDNQNVYTIESDNSDEDDVNSIHSNKSNNGADKRIRICDDIEVDVSVSDDVNETYQCKCSSCMEETSLVVNNMVKLYKCTHCSLEVVDKELFDKHFQEYQNYKVKKIHLRGLSTDNQLFSCINCLFKTSSKTVMSKHILEYHVKTSLVSFMCAVCFNTYEDKDGVSNCHGEIDPFVMYMCPFCTFHFDQKIRLTNHISHHSAGNYSVNYFCKLCFVVFTSAAVLKEHIKKHKIAEKVISYKCLRCSYQSTNRVFVKEHIKIAHRRVVSRCHGEAGGPKAGHLNRNGEDGTVYRKCLICNRYMKNVSLVSHKRQHKFPCDMCQYNSHSQMRLDRHKEMHRYALTETVHTCQKCFSLFKRCSNLVKHMKVHQHPRDCK